MGGRERTPGTVVYAHTPGPSGWHDLGDHLRAVAARAASLCECFRGGDLACWVAVLHDLGKVNPEFQRYLCAEVEGREHQQTQGSAQASRSNCENASGIVTSTALPPALLAGVARGKASRGRAAADDQIGDQGQHGGDHRRQVHPGVTNGL